MPRFYANEARVVTSGHVVPVTYRNFRSRVALMVSERSRGKTRPPLLGPVKMGTLCLFAVLIVIYAYSDDFYSPQKTPEQNGAVCKPEMTVPKARLYDKWLL